MPEQVAGFQMIPLTGNRENTPVAQKCWCIQQAGAAGDDISPGPVLPGQPRGLNTLPGHPCFPSWLRLPQVPTAGPSAHPAVCSILPHFPDLYCLEKEELKPPHPSFLSPWGGNVQGELSDSKVDPVFYFAPQVTAPFLHSLSFSQPNRVSAQPASHTRLSSLPLE